MKQEPELKRIISSLAIAIGHLLLCLVLVVLADQLKLPDRSAASVMICMAFVGINILWAKWLRLQQETKEFWSLKKIGLFFCALPAGAAIGLFPLLQALLFSKIQVNEISLTTRISFASIAITLVIVSWEELWFRGVYLNYCKRYFTAAQISVAVGLLFLAMHLLNPEVELIRSGPALFFAGALLTSTYFLFRSIWLPIGLHFGNNYASTLFNSRLKDHVWFGTDGRLSALLLALLFFITLFIIKRQRNRESEQAHISRI